MTGPSLFTLLFWCSLLAVSFTFLGYPILIYALGQRRRRTPSPLSEPPPLVSCLVVVHNEAHRIRLRLQNLLTADYPAERLEIVLVSDGSTDATAAAAQALGDARINVIVQPSRQGKAAGLNVGLAKARGDIIVFADARQSFDPGALRALARNFSDPQVGAVSGNYSLDPAIHNVGEGVDAYWRLEKFIRQAESRIDSVVGCTGAIYAIRRSLFREIPPDTILDDVVIPMQVVAQGYRVVFETEAQSFDPQRVEPASEFVRKRRTLAGNFQMLFRYPGWLWPGRRLWWQLFCHKYLRLAAPLFLFALLLANAALLPSPFYAWCFWGQCGFYLLAVAGILLPGIKIRLLTLPAGFVFLNFMTVAGFWHYLTRPADAGWERTS
jgi:cellulose synthase/poly-beta-1,6-N-acetylglucosamine synthase-like glycosyltransferase